MQFTAGGRRSRHAQEWHWSILAKELGQVLYRWKLNQLLDSSELPYRLAETGEDRGRLVALTDEARAALVSSAVQRTDPNTGDRVRHAVALFRGRGATEHDVRSSVLALHGVLEERRDLLKSKLIRKDEGALFQIANEFAIRHQRSDQHHDYDPVFLDWIFWWYLATIELTDRILARPT